MFDPSSRYYSLEEGKLTVTRSDGTTREIRYKRRRFIPQPEDASTLAEHRVVQGDRLDNIAARWLGEPTQFWRIADANLAIDPSDLTGTPGEKITILIPTR
jgi:hypothetical protein